MMYKKYCWLDRCKEISMRLMLKEINWYIEAVTTIGIKTFVLMIALPDNDNELEILKQLGFTEHSVV